MHDRQVTIRCSHYSSCAALRHRTRVAEKTREITPCRFFKNFAEEPVLEANLAQDYKREALLDNRCATSCRFAQAGWIALSSLNLCWQI